jgi:hypothetical protein
MLAARSAHLLEDPRATRRSALGQLRCGFARFAPHLRRFLDYASMLSRSLPDSDPLVLC